MRTPLIAGNWKLNKTIGEATAFVNELRPLVEDAGGVEVLLCPVFTALSATAQAAEGSAIAVGAQDIFWKNSGAYTGEVSAPLLKDAGATYAVIGHSERRCRFGVPEPELSGDAGRVFGDNDTTVNKKTLAALENGLAPIICVGETLDERQAGETDAIVQSQTRAALQGVAAEADLVFAYEPVWAIGTGETCEADEANRVCGVIRATVAEVLGDAAGARVRVQYGGSVKPDNAAALLSQPDVDGALVGGASIQADSFLAIVRAGLAGKAAG